MECSCTVSFADKLGSYGPTLALHLMHPHCTHKSPDPTAAHTEAQIPQRQRERKDMTIGESIFASVDAYKYSR
jgi:hypothetical protein